MVSQDATSTIYREIWCLGFFGVLPLSLGCPVVWIPGGGLVVQSHPAFCHLMDYSPPGSSIHRISQARIVEWVVISFTMGSSQPRIKPGLLLWQADSLPMSHLGTVKMGCAVLSHFRLVRLFTTQWTIALHDPLSMRFSGQEYWSGLPCPHPGDLPNPGIELISVRPSALVGGFFTTSTP